MVSHAEIVLAPRTFSDSRFARSSRADSKGTILLDSLETGEYTFEIRINREIVASIGSSWVQADAPTLKIHIYLDDGSLTLPEAQDFQQFRVYRAERLISVGSKLFGSLEEIQGYVDGMMGSPWWESEFPEVRAVQVRMGKDKDLARGGIDFVQEETDEAWEPLASGHIELLDWGWDELTALHEIAHVVSAGTAHGQVFARNFHFLVSRMLGDSAASQLALVYAAEGVRW